ncbi:hypothetical protein B0A52_04394 [Exophiala mesophila]|uniref:EF hand domain protein n=1 Tax=Exophiala mesophila TaxID=212818 RepID=A0A438N8T1_EXOME|nr:hypothetical protein B0A52_04394 [Exophiala mesophila]
MAEQSYRRPLLLALAGAVTLTLSYYTIVHYASTKPHSTASASRSLHRSNAVRRPRARGRWRPGFGRNFPPEYNPLQAALEELDMRNENDPGFGDYTNTFFSSIIEQNLQNADLRLRPNNLQSIYDMLIQQAPEPWTPLQRESLRLHIHGMFAQRFLDVRYPEGFIIGDDVHDLARAMVLVGVIEEVVFQAVRAHDHGHVLFNATWSPIVQTAQADGGADELDPREALHALADHRRDDDDGDADSEMPSLHEDDDEPGGGQNMLDLLYHIAADQARRQGYIHRGVECNNCGVQPIQGIRYHCANCFDFDLCESCEAGSPHIKSHVFYKIRIPAPSRGHIKQVAKPWYPGKPNRFMATLSEQVSKALLEETGMDRMELAALYDQFKCLAGTYWAEDPTRICLAIDRKAFDAYFIPTTMDRPSPANLIYDRIFAFYDSNGDGLIGFEEFIRGFNLLHDRTRLARLERIFNGYDLDADGYVDRKDFLRMFRAYYALTKELSREMVNNQEDFGYVEEEIQEVVQGSQPISAVFGGGMLSGHESRGGQGKQRRPNGDLVISDGAASGVLLPDSEMHGNRERAIGNAALRDRTRNSSLRSYRASDPEDEPLFRTPSTSQMQAGFEERDSGSESEANEPIQPTQMYGWPPAELPEPEDVIHALGQQVALEDITDSVDRSRVLYAQARRLDAEFDAEDAATRERALVERWERRAFYLDEEEGMTRPAGYAEPDSSDDEAGGPSSPKPSLPAKGSPRRRSMQSRSSSKVRFDDSAIDTDYETRSNASSRSVPVNERWGGLELGQAEADLGKDILYQAVQQGFNELLDYLFKSKEDEWMMACRTREERHRHRAEMEKYRQALEQTDAEKEEASMGADKHLTEEALTGSSSQVEYVTAEEIEEIDETNAPEGSARDSNSDAVAPIVEAADMDDHIELMFGGQTTSGKDDSQGQTPLLGDKAESVAFYQDPTLPQHRPSEGEDAKVESNDVPGNNSTAPLAKPLGPFDGDPEAARKLFTQWTLMDAVEEECQKRGGYGRLDLQEFRAKMVAEDDVLPPASKDGDPSHIWESSTELGRLGFIGTWLEMANF